MKKIVLLAITVFVVFMSSCGSNPGTQPGNTPSTAFAGEAIYKRACVTCHQAGGEGLTNTFPPLAKSDYLADKEKTIRVVIKGASGEMVVNGKTYNGAMAQLQLSDEEVAAVLTYVNTSFGNAGGAITADEVKGVRAKM